MGFGHLGPLAAETSAWRKLGFGAIPASDAPTLAGNGTDSIGPTQQSSGTRSAAHTQRLAAISSRSRFPAAESARSTLKYDPADPAVNGVAIHVDDPTFAAARSPSRLLDMAPETATFDDAPLPSGRQFKDFRTALTIETLRRPSGRHGEDRRSAGSEGDRGSPPYLQSPKAETQESQGRKESDRAKRLQARQSQTAPLEKSAERQSDLAGAESRQTGRRGRQSDDRRQFRPARTETRLTTLHRRYRRVGRGSKVGIGEVDLRRQLDVEVVGRVDADAQAVRGASRARGRRGRGSASMKWRW